MQVPSTVLLGEVCEILSGFAFKSAGFNSEGRGLPVIRIRDVLRGSTDTFYEGSYDPAFIVESGEILIGMDGEFNRARWNSSTALLNQRVCKIRGKPGALDDGYLFHLLPGILKEIEERTPFVTVKHLSAKELRAIELSLPPLDEQKRIAAILDKADALRAKRSKALALLDSLTQSIFLQMFGEDADGTPIGELISQGKLLLHKDGNHGSNYPRADDFGIEGVPFLSARSINDEGAFVAAQVQYLNSEKAAKLKIGWIEAGDVLLSHNASVGKVGLYRGEFGRALIGTSLTAFRANQTEIVPEFLYAALRGDYFQQQLSKTMGQTTRNQVAITAQKHLKLRIPSIDDQRTFMHLLNIQSTVFARGMCCANVLDSLFNSLQHRAFSGQL